MYWGGIPTPGPCRSTQVERAVSAVSLPSSPPSEPVVLSAYVAMYLNLRGDLALTTKFLRVDRLRTKAKSKLVEFALSKRVSCLPAAPFLILATSGCCGLVQGTYAGPRRQRYQRDRQWSLRERSCAARAIFLPGAEKWAGGSRPDEPTSRVSSIMSGAAARPSADVAKSRRVDGTPGAVENPSCGTVG